MPPSKAIELILEGISRSRGISKAEGIRRGGRVLSSDMRMMKYVKETYPKEYQAVKDVTHKFAVEPGSITRPAPELGVNELLRKAHIRRYRSLSRSQDEAMGAIFERMYGKRFDPNYRFDDPHSKRMQYAFWTMAERNLLPSVGFGVAAADMTSRGKKPKRKGA